MHQRVCGELIFELLVYLNLIIWFKLGFAMALSVNLYFFDGRGSSEGLEFWCLIFVLCDHFVCMYIDLFFGLLRHALKMLI